MEAGRELDALVAERVMGWIRAGTLFPSEKARQDWSDGHLLHLPPIPHYSTDIADAWLVVERFDSYELSRMASERTGKPDIWARLTRYKPPALGGSMGQTQAHAICLAALRAVAGREEQEGGSDE